HDSVLPWKQVGRLSLSAEATAQFVRPVIGREGDGALSKLCRSKRLCRRDLSRQVETCHTLANVGGLPIAAGHTGSHRGLAVEERGNVLPIERLGSERVEDRLQLLPVFLVVNRQPQIVA